MQMLTAPYSKKIPVIYKKNKKKLNNFNCLSITNFKYENSMDQQKHFHAMGHN